MGSIRLSWPLQEINPDVTLTRESYGDEDAYGPHFDRPRLVETRVSEIDSPQPLSHHRPSDPVLLSVGLPSIYNDEAHDLLPPTRHSRLSSC